MQLTVNGDAYELAGPATVAELLTRLGLAAGDRVEIVHFVGGG